jgi:hypothetical protein
MRDNLLNTEYEQNPFNRSGASEAPIHTYRRHTKIQFFLSKKGGGGQNLQIKKKIFVVFSQIFVISEHVRGYRVVLEFMKRTSELLSFHSPFRAVGTDRIEVVASYCATPRSSCSILFLVWVDFEGGRPDGGGGKGNWGRVCSLAGRGAKWWASRDLTPPVSIARVSHPVKSECTAGVTICWYVFVNQCIYHPIAAFFRFYKISA